MPNSEISVIHWFRRDLRVADNLALSHAAKPVYYRNFGIRHDLECSEVKLAQLPKNKHSDLFECVEDDFFTLLDGGCGELLVDTLSTFNHNF